MALARAEHDKLDVAFFQLGNNLRDKIEPLLPGQTAHDADQQGVFIPRKPEFGLQFYLIKLFPAYKVAAVVAFVDHFVCGWVVLLVAQAVYDAVELMASGAQKAVKPLAVFTRLDFVRVCIAHGCDEVGIHKPALEHVDIALIFELVARKVRVRQAKHVADRLFVPNALIAQVVDRHDGTDSAVKGIILELRLQKERDCCRLPVVAVDDVGAEAQIRQNGEHRLAKKCKFFHILMDVPIQVVGLEVKFIVDKVHRYAVVLQLKNPAVLPAPRERNLNRLDKAHLLHIFVRDTAVFWHDEADVDLLFVKRRRQRPRHVGKPARFCERDGLGRYK